MSDFSRIAAALCWRSENHDRTSRFHEKAPSVGSLAGKVIEAATKTCRGRVKQKAHNTKVEQ
jgi:hypothetical protein